jgi:hypothetical protein
VTRPRLYSLALGSLLASCSPAPAQVVTARGLMLESPTLVSVQVADEPWSATEPLHFTGDQCSVTRVEDKEWDGPGVAVYCVVFNPRPFQAPPAPFLISGPRGTSILLSWLDLSGVRTEIEWNVIDPRDFNRDKLWNVLDFHAFMASWSECGDARWYDGDGACDARDPAAFLAAWRE